MKKSMKKITALLLAMIMIMAMGISLSAATINLTNADNAVKKMIQVIETDPTSTVGWKFTSEETANAYKQAFNNQEAEEIIVALIKNKNPEAQVPTAYQNVEAATAAQIDQALSNLTIDGEYSSEITKPGVYAIDAQEEGFTYKRMAVFLAFEGETTDEVQAKKSSTSIEKETTDEDRVTAVGDTIGYEVNTSFPYIKIDAQNKYYKIIDTLEGASYVEESVTVTIGQESVNVTPTFTTDTDNRPVMTIDLSSYITDDNIHAGKAVKVTYNVKVTDPTVKNTVSHEGNDVEGSDEEQVYSGEITLIKTNEDETEKLEGAEFEVTKGEEETPLAFILGEDGVYTYDPEVTENSVTRVSTGTDGTAVINGLDIGTYTFTEVTAPEGYSLNENPTEVTLEVTEDGGKAEAAVQASVTVKDTALNALPSTGGKGTLTFTTIGITVILAAAVLLVARRRRSA